MIDWCHEREIAIVCADADAPLAHTECDWTRATALIAGTSQAMREAAFEKAVSSIAACARELIDSLETTQPPKNREEEAAKAKARSALRFANA